MTMGKGSSVRTSQEVRVKNLGWLALIAFAGGVALLGYSVAVGESQVHLVLLFPVVTGGGAIGLAGMALVFLAMFLGFFSFARPFGTPTPAEGPARPTGAATPPAPRAKFGGVVFVGPIPIVFGSSPKISKVMLAAAVVMTILLLAFFFLVLA
jgi:uncharacterized protein (TIGR00304 family)